MDLWQQLQTDSRPIVLYGMGDGADKILRVLEGYGRSAADFFASDEFVRGQQFHGKTVLRYDDVVAKYGERGFILLVAFASARPELIERIRQLSLRHDLYVPDVPVTLGEQPLEERGAIFDGQFAEEHREVIALARALFADESSVALYDTVIDCRLSGRVEGLLRLTSTAEEVYTGLLHSETFSFCMDLGAYTGDTVRELRQFCPHLRKIYSMEPDQSSFRRLCRFLESEGLTDLVEAKQAAAYETETELLFSTKGNRNSTLVSAGHGAKTFAVQGLSPDAFAGDRPVDYIKYDVEGAEAAALRGSVKLLRTQRPALLVSLYHRAEDLFALPLLLQELAGKDAYRFYLRRLPGFPAWDLNLYAIPV